MCSKVDKCYNRNGSSATRQYMHWIREDSDMCSKVNTCYNRNESSTTGY